MADEAVNSTKKREQGQFLYQEIAEFTLRSITEGNIPYGEKLPSLRKMSSHFGCSVSVVMQAYGDLERRGCVRAVEKSGFFAVAPPLCSTLPRPRPQLGDYSLKSEETRPLSIIGRIVEAANDASIVPLGAGLPHHSLLPVAGLKKALVRVARDEARLYREYTDELGSLALRKEIVRYMARRGVSVDISDIIVTNGCTEALVLAVLVCSAPGDVVAIESPVFLGTLQILHDLGRRIIPVPTSAEYGMDLDALETILTKRRAVAVMISPAFQNPLGFVMPKKNRRRAAELAAEYGIPFIEDDIYGECSFHQEIHRPIRSFDASGEVIYCSSFSKTISPGMRIGWLIGGKRHRRAASTKMTLTLGGSPLLQEAMAEYLAGARYERQIWGFRKKIARQAVETEALLTEFFPQGTAVSAPQGGYYFWVDLPGGVDSLKLFEEALKFGIGTAPGSAFGSGGRYANCIRVSYGSPVTERTEWGIAELGRITRRLQSQN